MFNIIEEFVSEIAGKEGVKLLNLLKNNINISEFDLAEELKLNINQVRNLLYKLNAYNLVYSIRKKDREKGWYIYYWTFNFRHAYDLLKTKKQQEIEKLKDDLVKEAQHKFFVCPNNCIRLELEEALEQDYKCNECECILKPDDSTKKVNEMQAKIHKLNNDLQELSKPLILPKPEIEEKVKKRVKKLKKIKKRVKKLKRFKKLKKKIKKHKKYKRSKRK